MGPGLGPGLGPGVGPGLGPGLGPGQGANAVEEEPRALEIYTSLDAIKKKVRQGSFAEESMTIYNFKNIPTHLTFSVSGSVAPYVKLSMEDAIIQPNASAKLNIRLLGDGVPGLYTGILKLDGDFQALVPIELTIIKEGKIPVEALIIKIDTLQQEAYRGQEFRYKVDLINLLSGTEFDVHLNFTLYDVNRTTIIPLGEQTTSVPTFISIIRKAALPSDVPLGDYILAVDAKYVGFSANANTLFF